MAATKFIVPISRPTFFGSCSGVGTNVSGNGDSSSTGISGISGSTTGGIGVGTSIELTAPVSDCLTEIRGGVKFLVSSAI